jgi:sigma-B regulation protein RsbU (phosphoserine phosphatase)
MAASIMVIDNDQTVLALLDEILTMTGHETHLYTYGLPDQEEILRVRPDLIICDYLMDGDQVGQELWGLLSREPVLAHTRLLLCTTFAGHLAERTGWWSAAGVPIVAKPFDVDHFLCAVHHALASSSGIAPQTRVDLLSAATPQALFALNTHIGA